MQEYKYAGEIREKYLLALAHHVWLEAMLQEGDTTVKKLMKSGKIPIGRNYFSQNVWIKSYGSKILVDQIN